MFPAWMRGFFPPSVDFVQESDLLSRFQDLCTVKHWRESELASCARRGGEESHWYREEEDVSRRFGKRDSGRNVCVHVCVCPLSTGSCHSEGPKLEEFALWNTSSSAFFILGSFPAIFCWLLLTQSGAGVSQVCEWEPKFGVFFLCLFPALYYVGNHIPSLTSHWFFFFLSFL